MHWTSWTYSWWVANPKLSQKNREGGGGLDDLSLHNSLWVKHTTLIYWSSLSLNTKLLRILKIDRQRYRKLECVVKSEIGKHSKILHDPSPPHHQEIVY